MTQSQALLLLIAAGESETLEFKKSTAELTAVGEALCAFLNTQGGTVLIGVTPQGRLVGQDVSDGTQQEIAGMLRKLEPSPDVEVRFWPLGGKDAIELRVRSAGLEQPYVFDGRPFLRMGSTTVRMPQDSYHRRLLSRSHEQNRWELVATEVEIDALRGDLIQSTVRRALETGRLTESGSTSPRDLLARLGLLRNGKVLRAAQVLFGTQFLPDFSQCQLKMARFRGDRKDEFVDQRQLHGCAFDMLDEAMLFLRRHLPVAGRVEPGLFERHDEPIYPPIALRESLVNAFCHRDYARSGGAVELAVFDHKLEIRSTGRLPEGITLPDLKTDHFSVPRNPLICNVFYLRGLVERWGRGTQTIIRLCLEAGHPEPEFLEDSGGLTVRFSPAAYSPPTRVDGNLSNRQREILLCLNRSQWVPFRQIREALKHVVADSTLREDLAYLRNLGLVRSEGRGRGAAWSRNKPEV